MTDLVAIVRATRKSALAVGRMQRLRCMLRDAKKAGHNCSELEKALARTRIDHHRAEAILLANPLPGDKS